MRLLGATVATALFVFPLFAQAQWKFKETKDPFTDQLQKSRAFSQTTVSGLLWELEAECYRSFGVGVDLPQKTATAHPSFDVKYRIDSNPFHNSRWITPYAYSQYVAINKEDWDNILKETKDDRRY